MIGSMHIAWGIWYVTRNVSWISSISETGLIVVLGSFYIAAMVGNFIGGLLVTRIRKRIIYVSTNSKCHVIL